jgi:hypothetical protein
MDSKAKTSVKKDQGYQDTPSILNETHLGTPKANNAYVA